MSQYEKDLKLIQTLEMLMWAELAMIAIVCCTIIYLICQMLKERTKLAQTIQKRIKNVFEALEVLQ